MRRGISRAGVCVRALSVLRGAVSVALLVGGAAAAGVTARAQGFTELNVPLPEPPAVEEKAAERKADVPAGVGVRGQSKRLLARTAYVVPRGAGEWTTGDAKVDGFIRASGSRNGVDPYLIYSMMWKESSFKPYAVSPVGAKGLMQLMPGTAARFGVRNIFDPEQNIEGGTKYLRFLFNTFGDERLDLVLAGYNAGEGAVMKYGWRVPPYAETQDYVLKISGRYGASYHRKPAAASVARAGEGGDGQAGQAAAVSGSN